MYDNYNQLANILPTFCFLFQVYPTYMDLECNLPIKLNWTDFGTDFVNCVVKSPIRGRLYARLILEKRALAKVLFLYFGLRNYSLIKNIIEPFFLNKFCLPHSQSLKLGNGDNIQRHKVSLGQSLQFFQSISVLCVSLNFS